LSFFDFLSAKTTSASKLLSVICAVLFWSGDAMAAEETGVVRVKVSGISKHVGTIRATLDGSEAAFKNTVETTQSCEIAANDDEVELVFRDVPPGVYAIKVIHDENDDNKLNQNLLGIPSEKYGISNNVMGKFGLPSFKDASFNVSGGDTVLSIAISKHKFF